MPKLHTKLTLFLHLLVQWERMGAIHLKRINLKINRYEEARYTSLCSFDTFKSDSL
jgi:hypothetical protein